jgi:hypothetical protein
MALDLVSVTGLWPILRRIPWLVALVGRWYFTPERLASLVYVDLFPRHESARVDLGGVASFQLHLQLMNLTPFELELDRANFRFYCGGVPLETHVLEKRKIRSGASDSLFLSSNISDGAAIQIAGVFRGNQAYLEGNIEFNCSVRSFAKKVGTLSGVQTAFVNESQRESRKMPSDA